MAVVNVNGISGINSITAQSNALDFYNSAGNTLSIGANLTGNVTGNATGLSGTPNITVGTISATSLNASGVVTATSFSGSGANLTGIAATTDVRTNSLVVSGVSTVAAGSTAAPSISPTGDSDTGIFFPSADTIAFGEGGSEALRIDSSGRVGIGTTNPTNKIHVYHTTASDIALFESNQTFATIAFKSNTNSFAQTVGVDAVGGLQLDQKNTSSYISFAIGSERLRIDSSGNLKLSTAATSILNSSGKKILNQTGSVLQVVKNFSSSAVTVNSSTATTVLSVNITIEQGNKIFTWFSGDMNANSSSTSWQILGFNIGGTQYHDKIIEHSQGFNMNADHSYLTPALNAGTYTVAFNTRQGSGSVTYNEANFGEGLVIMAMEISA